MRASRTHVKRIDPERHGERLLPEVSIDGAGFGKVGGERGEGLEQGSAVVLPEKYPVRIKHQSLEVGRIVGGSRRRVGEESREHEEEGGGRGREIHSADAQGMLSFFGQGVHDTVWSRTARNRSA